MGFLRATQFNEDKAALTLGTLSRLDHDFVETLVGLGYWFATDSTFTRQTVHQHGYGQACNFSTAHRDMDFFQDKLATTHKLLLEWISLWCEYPVQSIIYTPIPIHHIPHSLTHPKTNSNHALLPQQI
jgi:hypothetical protein